MYIVKKLNQGGSLHLATFLGVVVALAVGAVGYRVIGNSHAAPKNAASKPIFVMVSDYANATANSPKLVTIQDSVFYTSGPQTVVQLPVGVSASFSPNRGGGVQYPTQTCYLARAVGSPVQATITSGSSQAVVTIQNDLNFYQKVCLAYGSSGTFPNFSIRNESGGTLNVYQQVLEMTQ